MTAPIIDHLMTVLEEEPIAPNTTMEKINQREVAASIHEFTPDELCDLGLDRAPSPPTIEERVIGVWRSRARAEGGDDDAKVLLDRNGVLVSVLDLTERMEDFSAELDRIGWPVLQRLENERYQDEYWIDAWRLNNLQDKDDEEDDGE